MNTLFIKNNYFYIICFLPLAILTGPALPDILITLTSCVFLFFLIFTRGLLYEFRNYLLIPVIGYIFILIGFLNSGFIVSREFLESSLYLRFLFFPLAFMFFFRENYYNKFKIFLSFCVFSMFILCLDVLFQFTNNGKDLINSNFTGYYSGFFGDEKRSGFYIFIFSYLSVVYLFLYKREKFKFLFSTITIIILIPSIYLSGEKISIFNFLISTIILYFINFNKISIKINIVLLLFLVFSSIVIFESNILNQYIKNFERSLGVNISTTTNIQNDLINKFETVDKGYLIIWKTAIKTINLKNNLFLGNGTKTYEKFCKKLYNTQSNKLEKHQCSRHPHNLFLQFLYSFGIIITVLIYIVVIYFIYLSLINAKDKNPSFILLPIFIVLLLPHNTYNFLNNWTATQIWLFLSIVILLNTKKIN